MCDIGEIMNSAITFEFGEGDDEFSAGNKIMTDFVDLWRTMIIDANSMKIEIQGVDHYCEKFGMILNGSVNGRKMGVGIHPNFDQEFENYEFSYYNSIESLSVVLLDHCDVEKLRKHMASKNLDFAITRNLSRLRVTDFPFDICLTESFKDKFL